MDTSTSVATADTATADTAGADSSVVPADVAGADSSVPPPSESTAPPVAAPTGSTQSCSTGERLDDTDGDSWGECVVDERPVDVFAAQAAAEGAGLPPGIPCDYPGSILAGSTAMVGCAVVNADASEGTWTFTLADDSSVSASPSYTETKAAPPTLPPVTQPIRPLVEASTDPQFDTCKDAKAHGYGPYRAGEPEYSWYRDADDDGVVCE